MNDFRDFMRVLMRRKWSIFIPTLACVFVTAILGFFLQSKWEVECIIKPSQLLTQTEAGILRELTINDPVEIATLINQETYLLPISTRLKLDPRKFPNIRAAHLEKTNLVKASLRTAEKEQGKAILEELFNLVQVDLDKRIQLERQQMESSIANYEKDLVRLDLEIEAQNNQIQNTKNEIKLTSIDIKTAEIQKTGKRKEVETTESILAISRKRAESISKEMEVVNQRVQRIERDQEKVLSGEKMDPLSLLLYSNEIQENLQYANTLDQQMSQEMIKQENLKLTVLKTEEETENIDMLIERYRTKIETLNIGIKSIQNEIQKILNGKQIIQNSLNLLNERKLQIEFSSLVKEPTSSVFPVTPKKRLNIAIAAIFGFVFFVMIAFLQEYL